MLVTLVSSLRTMISHGLFTVCARLVRVAYESVIIWKKIGTPMVWRDNFYDCYSCAVKIIGIDQNNCDQRFHPHLLSARDLFHIRILCLSEDKSFVLDTPQDASETNSNLHIEPFDQNKLI